MPRCRRSSFATSSGSAAARCAQTRASARSNRDPRRPRDCRRSAPESRRSGGTSGSSERNTMPVCCCVSPLHSSTSTGSDTVGNPTSTTSCAPRAHTACQFGRSRAPPRRRGHRSGSRARAASAAAGTPVARRQHDRLARHRRRTSITAWIQRWRTCGTSHANDAERDREHERSHEPTRRRPGASLHTGIIPDMRGSA